MNKQLRERKREREISNFPDGLNQKRKEMNQNSNQRKSRQESK